MSKFYVVKKGRQVGIFDFPWEKVKLLVDKYPGAIYKSFTNYDEAAKYFYKSDDEVTVNSNIKVYTDGSCRNEKGGYGVVVVNGDTHTCYSGKVPIKPCTNQKAELYAILIAMRNVDEDEFTIITDSKYAIGCCNEWLENWKKKSEWKKTIENSDLIDAIDISRGERKIKFEHVYGHTGNVYNEMCDKLAKQYT